MVYYKGREAEGGGGGRTMLKMGDKGEGARLFFKKGERREALDGTGELPTTECMTQRMRNM